MDSGYDYFFFVDFLAAFLTTFFAGFLALAAFFGLDLVFPFPALGPTRKDSWGTIGSGIVMFCFGYELR